MSAGLQPTRAQLDQTVGQNVRTFLALIAYFNNTKTLLDSVAGGFAGITSTTGIFGANAYTDVPSGSGDASRMYNGMADMVTAYTLIHGTHASPWTVTDLTTNVNFLTGTPQS